MTEKSGVAFEFHQLLRGSALIFVGNLIGLGSSFGTRLIAANHLGSSDYGLIVLGLTLINVTALVVLVGLPQGVARQISRSENKAQVFFSSLLIAGPAAVLTAILSVLFADRVSMIFNEPTFVPVLVVFAVTLPFFVLVKLFVGGIRGVEHARGKVMVQDIFGKGVLLIAIGIGSFLGVGVVGIALSWVVTFVVTAAVAVYVLYNHTTLLDVRSLSVRETSTTSYSLITFSLPLMFAGAASLLLNEMDNLFLGFFHSSAAVGVYDAAFTLARMLLIFLLGFAFLFLPAFSRLDEAGDRQKMDRLYKIVVKWVTFLTFPMFISLVFFPDYFISLLFGTDFVDGGLALVIVSVGLFSSVLLGMNGNALMAIGETRLILRANVVALAVNIVLNAALVPAFGITGAAVATSISVILVDSYRSYYLYSLSGIHPFYRSYLRPLTGSVIVAAALFATLNSTVSTGTAALAFVVTMSVLHVLVIVLLGGIDAEDLELLGTVNEQVAVDLQPVRTILQRFVK